MESYSLQLQLQLQHAALLCRIWYTLDMPVTLSLTRRHPVEQKPRARYDEFAEQFTAVLYEHWSDILQVINRQSPRVAALLRVATPSGLKRENGTWRVKLLIKRVVQQD